MIGIDFAAIEKKWQDRWAKAKVFEADDKSKKPKYYVLEMFPYPSGSGLHMGHALNYVIGDVYARYKKMKGFEVLHPMGYDALGLPAENAAIKEGTHPEDYTNASIKNYISQQKNLGISYDWNRVVNTASPDYYKWDQWIFLKMLEKGLAYQKTSAVNWCPKCNTVLANEQVENGKCWRHEDTDVEVRHLKQWFLKTTEYADELYENLDNMDWPERTKAMQKNWIGKSHGTEIDFEINGIKWPIFTTRPDTIFGVTFMVVSAQHPRLDELVTAEYRKDVDKFLKKLKSVSQKAMKDVEELEKEGVFTGSYAINPATEKKIPIWIANFVIADYGSGMVMADAHDQRDLEFAQKYGINLIETVLPEGGKSSDPNRAERAFTDYGVLVNSGQFDGMKTKEAINKIGDWLIEKNVGRRVVNFKLRDWGVSRQRYWGTPIPVVYCEGCKKHIEENSLALSFYDQKAFDAIKSGRKTIESRALNPEEEDRYFGDVKNGDYLKGINKITGEIIYLEVVGVKKYKTLKELFDDKDVLEKVSSGEVAKSLKELEENYSFTEDYLNRIKKNGLIAWEIRTVVPGVVGVPEKDLPVRLPKDVKFGKGNPLESAEDWLNVKCPKCGGKGRREIDTMDTFVNSSWYFMRYCDANNDKEIFDPKKVKEWCPVDFYIGGAEHACMHLIYSRFYTKFLRDLGLIDFNEPAVRLFHQGMLHGEGGIKMSKSKGNVVNPDEVSKKYGIDTARYFLLNLAEPDKKRDWSEAGIMGASRFMRKVVSFFDSINIGSGDSKFDSVVDEAVLFVEKNIEAVTYRKATIKIKEVFDKMVGQNSVSKESVEKFLKILAPFCPHVAEELWEKIGGKDLISVSSWPEVKVSKKKDNGVDLTEKVLEEVRDVAAKFDDKKNLYLYAMPFEVDKIDAKKIGNETGKKVKVFAVNDKEKYDPEGKGKKAKPGKVSFYFE